MLVCIFQVFSDVYAVLHKNWKETHHDRLCEILADVEHKFSVEISFVKGAYQFQGTLTTLSNVFKYLRRGSGENRNASPETGGDDDQSHAQQRGESLDVRDADSRSAVAHGDSDAAQPENWGEVKDGRIESTSETPSDTQNAVGDDSRVIPAADEDNAVDQRTEHETAQTEQAENLPLAMLADDAISDDFFRSPSDAPLLNERDSTHSVEAEAYEEVSQSDDSKQLDQHQDNNSLPGTDHLLSSSHVTESSLQTKENHEELHASAISSHSAVDATDEPDKSTETATHEQSGLEALHASFLQEHTLGASSDLTEPSMQSAMPRVETAASDRDTELSSMRQLPADVPTHLEQKELEASCPSIQSSSSDGALVDKHTNDPQSGTEMSALSKSSTIPGRASPAVDKARNDSREELTAKYKDLFYKR